MSSIERCGRRRRRSNCTSRSRSPSARDRRRRRCTATSGASTSSRFPADVDLEVSSIWALDDFTDENGATRVVLDSHRLPNDTRFTLEQSVPAEMPRGSVVLYLGSTYHGGGANQSDQVRRGINVDYVLGWLRQEENQYLSYTLDEVRGFPERVQRLLGYEVGAYALGYIDGGRSPMELLHADRAGATQSFQPG